ncbi:MAG: aa3-type cytochrome c oxidase subunit IV [Proteobacteria bacterium]|nr:aa3-type cytochrome c oxidase subunit IV [Pseudomonadota bacterium]
MNIDTSKSSPSMDYTQHLQTYRDFIRLTKYAIVFVVLILVGMKIFLA